MKAKVKGLLGKRVFALMDGDEEEVFTVKDFIIGAAGIAGLLLLIGSVGHVECASAL